VGEQYLHNHYTLFQLQTIAPFYYSKGLLLNRIRGTAVTNAPALAVPTVSSFWKSRENGGKSIAFGIRRYRMWYMLVLLLVYVSIAYGIGFLRGKFEFWHVFRFIYRWHVCRGRVVFTVVAISVFGVMFDVFIW